MEKTVRELSEYLVDRLREINVTSRLLVGISGIPASGKSTLVKLIVEHCNELLKVQNYQPQAFRSEAILVGLDGWHLTRAQLNAFPDPKLAHDRRGAHWTFDGAGYAAFVSALRAPVVADRVIAAPSFDHARKDPEPDAVSVSPHHRLVVIEGLYTFLSIDPWRAVGEMLDERWFIDIGIEEASRRLVKRHVITGVAKDLEEAIWRAEENDKPNGRFIMDNMLEPTRRIPSLDDSSFTEAVEHMPE
ncbi:P-loop containing nucleoside triphosphate hydrolase protein [Phellopilus nigrolimitatus]|nr:P-loop containing nucleoside triphosphate hydrolase protein [Phellopilus nigrolimitatus]